MSLFGDNSSSLIMYWPSFSASATCFSASFSFTSSAASALRNKANKTKGECYSQERN